MAQPPTTYELGDPSSSVLYGMVRDRFETFRVHAGSLRDGEGLPTFVEQAAAIERILRHLRLAGEVPVREPARAPPRPGDRAEDESQAIPDFEAAW